MADRVVVLSDLHLGAGKRCVDDPASLRPLWQNADRLILNGDTAEVHHVELRAVAARLTLRLLDLCQADGVAVTMLAGNHDPYISDIRHLHLADDQVLITHGDAFHPSISPWCPYAKRLRHNHDTALRQLPPAKREDLAARLDAIRYASHLEWLTEKQHRTRLGQLLVRPRNVWRLFGYWRQLPRLADDFARRYSPDARFVIYGHSHRQGIWRIGQRVMINTGAYGVPGRPRAVVIEDGALSVWPIVRRADGYRFGRRPVRRFDLPHDGPLITPEALDFRLPADSILLAP